MLKQNSELRAEARAALTDKWVMAAIATLIYSAVVGGLSAIPVVGILILLLTLPIAYGYAIVILDVFRGSDVNIGGLFDGFSDYGRIIGTKLLQAVYTVLWTLLLVIPGIIKYYSYAMTDFILKDQPELANNGAIEKSMAMCLFTLGIGYFFLQPYMQAAHAAFYEDLKAQAVEEVIVEGTVEI